MQLTDNEKQAIERGEAVSITLDRTDCVVIRKDVYDRIAADNGLATDEEVTRIAWEAGQEIGWNSPEMAQYDNYDAYRK